jgi:hypothetical protein
MSTVTNASLADALPSSVPKLEANGTNWAIFLVRFRDAVEAKGYWGHFDGTTPIPDPVLPDKPTTKETAAKDQWEKDERSAKSLLTQKLPDSTLMKVHTKGTVRERWEAVVVEYTQKGAYAQTDLRAKFLVSRCPEKGNVREFLENLRTKREELVQVGVVIDEKDYLSTIISSLPFTLSNFASAQLAAARMFAPSKSIEPDILLTLLMEEADRQKAQYARRASNPEKGKKEWEGPPNEALASMSMIATKPRTKGPGKGRANVTCWNCDRKGHYSNECKDPPKKDQAKDEGEKTPAESPVPVANVAATAEYNSGDDGAWAAEPVSDDEDWFEAAITESKALSHARDLSNEVAEYTKNPIDRPTMKWGNHAINERTIEPNTRPLDEPKGRENDRIARLHEESRNKTNWPSMAPESRDIECTTCNANVLVPRFEGEEDHRYETRDLPIVPIPGTAAPDPSPVINFSNTPACERVAKLPVHARNLFEGREMFIEGPGVAQDTYPT